MSKHENLAVLQEMWSNCQGCLLHQDRRSVVFGYGNPDAQILVVGEAPGMNEDREGVPFVGQAGTLLDQLLASVSVDPTLIEFALEEKFPPVEVRSILLHYIYYTNVVACRPPENRDPATAEQEICRARLHEIIYQVDPVLVISFGRISAEALLGKKCPVISNRGLIRDIEVPGRTGPVIYPMMVALHPSYLLRINDFLQGAEGMSGKTYEDILRAHRIVDQYNWLHYGVKAPSERPLPRTKENP
jgi:uracil-DNA glycosylase family 4